VQRASRYDLVRALAPRYAHVGKLEKGQLLDEVCQLTGYTRKHAVALLRHPPPDEPPLRGPAARASGLRPITWPVKLSSPPKGQSHQGWFLARTAERDGPP
jgi:hypothetical protein